MRAAAVLFPCALLLVSCGTPEYRAERSICEAEWVKRIPPNYVQQLVERTRYEERPTGQSTCVTTGNVTNCTNVMMTIAIPYTAVETVDANKSRRDVQIKACAAKACQAKFGNAECETSGG